MKWLAILNPIAGHNGESGLQPVIQQLKQELGVSCVYSERRNHTGEIVQKHRHYDGFIAVGGDGTISEVVNAMSHDRHVLAIVPAGTSNGLAHDLNLHSKGDAIQALNQPNFRKFDIINVRIRTRNDWLSRKMISTSGIGYIAGATEMAYRYKPRFGLFSHFIGAVLQPFQQEPFSVRLRFDGEPNQDMVVTNVGIHNTKFLGTFCLFPEARIDDGQLNVLYGRMTGFGQLMEDCGIFTRTRIFERSIHRAAQRLEIEIPRCGTVMVDGDLYSDVDAICYEVEPSRLTCCTAPIEERGLGRDDVAIIEPELPVAPAPIENVPAALHRPGLR
jgi:diacylglycerol kinase family enzyme